MAGVDIQSEKSLGARLDLELVLQVLLGWDAQRDVVQFKAVPDLQAPNSVLEIELENIILLRITL